MTVKTTVEYNGIEFQSELEARWSIFFDSMNINYEYEKVSYEILKNTWYAPTFYLYELDLFIQITKGEGHKAEEASKAVDFSKYKSIAVLGEIPNIKMGNVHVRRWGEGLHDYSSMFMYKHNYKGDYYMDYGGSDNPYCFCICPFCNKIGFEFDGRSARICSCKEHKQVHNGDKTYTNSDPRIVKAYNKSRNARFYKISELSFSVV